MCLSQTLGALVSSFIRWILIFVDFVVEMIHRMKRRAIYTGQKSCLSIYCQRIDMFSRKPVITIHVTNLAKFDAFEYWYNHSMQLIQHDTCTLIYASVGGCNFLFNILTNPILDIIYFFNIYWYIHFHFIFKMKIHVHAYWTLYDHFVL